MAELFGFAEPVGVGPDGAEKREVRGVVGADVFIADEGGELVKGEALQAALRAVGIAKLGWG